MQSNTEAEEVNGHAKRAVKGQINIACTQIIGRSKCRQRSDDISRTAEDRFGTEGHFAHDKEASVTQ